jgi:hypothetical protein
MENEEMEKLDKKFKERFKQIVKSWEFSSLEMLRQLQREGFLGEVRQERVKGTKRR